MKKLAAILLFALLFFNWYGYRLLSDIMVQKSDTEFQAKIDNDEYDESQLIELRVPINLPYHNDWDKFERYDGEVEIDGIHYKYVKRKVEKGELVLLCLPNNDKQLLQTARDNFFKLVNDLQQTSATGKKSETGNTAAFKGLFSEYQQEKNNWTIAALTIAGNQYPLNESLFTPFYFHSSPEQPPELA